MKKVKYCILGAGPAGLTFANKLEQLGENDYIVLEKENEAGGLCRSINVDGAPIDIGGGHFLDVKRPEVCKFLFGFMPQEEWLLFKRDSRIVLGEKMIGHPLETNIWQLPTEMQVKYLKSIAVAGCNTGKKIPKKFVDWIYWKFGNQISDDYMLPYNRKMFGNNLDNLGTYWLEKLPNVSFDETLLSCLNKKTYGTQPGHARFYYPREYGYGELWLRMAKVIEKHILYNQVITKMNVKEKVITTKGGIRIQAENIITTIPWESLEITSLEEMDKVISNINKLRHTGIEISYFEGNQESEAQWIYVPNENISYHRILSRKTFCQGSHGYWTETNLERVEREDKEFKYQNEYAYPLNTIDKPAIMSKLLSIMRENGIIGLGRWGEHEHYNSDVVVERAMKLAEEMVRL